MTATEEQVRQALRTIQDPQLNRDIVSLDVIKDLNIRGANVAFTIAMATGTAAGEQIKTEAEQAVMAIPGVDKVAVLLRAQAPSSNPAELPKPASAGVRHVIAVSSGKGGVGKSTDTVNLACTLAKRGARVGVLDADLYGPNIPMMLGISGQPAATGSMIIPFDRVGIKAMSIGLMVPEDQPIVWRGPRLHKAIQQFLFDVAWGELDHLLVDMPPGTGDAQLSLSQHVHLSGAVLVTTPQNVSVHDVRKAVRMFESVKVPILGVIENMAWFSPPGSDDRFEIFGSGGGNRITQEFGVPLLGQLPIDLAVSAGGDAGTPAVTAQPSSEFASSFDAIAKLVEERLETLSSS